MVPTSTCLNPLCNANTPGTVKTCPKCGKKTMTSRRVVMLGWVLVVLGMLLIGGMSLILWSEYFAMTHPGVRTADGSTFTGTLEQGRAAIQLFLAVLAFGVLVMLNGLWQIATGRRSLIFAGATVLVAAAIYFAARGMIAPGGVFGD